MHPTRGRGLATEEDGRLKGQLHGVVELEQIGERCRAWDPFRRHQRSERRTPLQGERFPGARQVCGPVNPGATESQPATQPLTAVYHIRKGLERNRHWFVRPGPAALPLIRGHGGNWSSTLPRLLYNLRHFTWCHPDCLEWG
ncbi:hypothetical protein NDU88_004035 [Pleurodeles waltl]|uniref:Uncharacterized protein n=1 Tax=Pleurodeles waltl TaxID=8319 RepID=A0AAV7V043_PLEWA|nr:hypothetical protein NDU88_004035 [Pleurodeles waltl]